eukprot:Nitzschia sp. Nitz4//scaffold258_size27474//11775//14618//NITZ4_008185-RA/size27474-augustus-gene-0.32-mRNA-1//1//CDS//3329544485//9344//frame0
MESYHIIFIVLSLVHLISATKPLSTMKTIGYAAHSPGSAMTPIHFNRREPRENDVAIEILFCGICHSDLHHVNSDWGPEPYPLVPGHEIVGQVTSVGSKVQKFKTGDKVAIGCMVDSCQTCDQCNKCQEQYCRTKATFTYGHPDKVSGGHTHGGYSKNIVVREEFVLSLPDGMDLSKTAPILCAGITTYSPLRHWNVKEGTRVAVIGLGGLGHMAVKLAVAMGAEVTVVSRSTSKEAAAKGMGAKALLASSDPDAMKAAASSFDVIIDTVPSLHGLDLYTPLLDVDGTLVIVGHVGSLEAPTTKPLIFGRRSVAGSLIGGIKETQECLDFCAKHNIYPDCEMIHPEEINNAFLALKKGDMAHRFVIDMVNLKVEEKIHTPYYTNTNTIPIPIKTTNTNNMKTVGYAAHSADANMTPFHFERREPLENDVAMEILFCGVCHSDLHTVNGDWGPQPYPLVPGHEIVGQVTAVGSKVQKYKVGDKVAVGCMVDSCQACDQCSKSQEQYCRQGMTPTYGAPDKHLDGKVTQGGYSKHIVVREEFVVSVPDGMDMAKAAPILCAGITTFSPLRNWGVKEGTRVGVIGLGGLGHMAVKLAVAMGAEVTVISRSTSKEAAAKAIGAKALLSSSDAEAMKAAAYSFDLIIDTIPFCHGIDAYTPLLDIDGSLVIVGQVGPLEAPMSMPLVFGRRSVAGSLIGGIKETQEVLDFCAKHNVYPECELIKPEEINNAFEALKKGDVAHRFVIDMATLSEQ